MHWCLYEESCSRNCFNDCPYSMDMCRCCISVSYKDCIGCEYNKGGVNNESKSTQESVENH